MKVLDKKRWIAIIAAVVLFTVSIGFRFAMDIASGFMSDSFDMEDSFTEEEIIEDGESTERIAKLSLEGEIMADIGDDSLIEEEPMHEKLIDQIEEAGADDSVKAILFKVNSPGGSIVETEQIYKKIKDMQEEYEKPIYVTMENMAASGGYYLSAPADKIYAQKSTDTGSIGVISETINLSELFDKLGIKYNRVQSDEFKDIMANDRDMTDEEKEMIQEMIDESYDDFVDVIVDGRDMDEEKVRDLGDGRLYTGKQAKENGLVDEIGFEEDALDDLKEDEGLEDATVFEYSNEANFFSSLTTGVKSFLHKDETQANQVKQIVRESNQPRAMYLSKGWR